jgi:hypothetical protein
LRRTWHLNWAPQKKGKKGVFGGVQQKINIMFQEEKTKWVEEARPKIVSPMPDAARQRVIPPKLLV